MNLYFDPKLLHIFISISYIRTQLLVFLWYYVCTLELVSNDLPMMHYTHYCVLIIHMHDEKLILELPTAHFFLSVRVGAADYALY